MKIALLGDIAFFGKYSIEKNKNILEYFEKVRRILQNYDFVIGNLETPFIQNHKTTGYKSAYIGSDIRNIELLKYLGISHVNLANNHIFDFGANAFSFTKEKLEENNIGYFGVENKQVIIEKEDNKIAINGYCCYSTNPLGMGIKGINILNFNDVKELIIRNHNKGLNNIVSIHAGQEHVNYPNYDHIEFARKLSNHASYVYYGHHPHVLQGIEFYNNSLLSYSIGNFCFDDLYTKKSNVPLVKQTDNNKSSIILELEYKNNVLINYQSIPIYSGELEIEINKPIITNNLNQFSNALLLNKQDYLIMRNSLLNEFIQSRKNQRNFKWYFQRLNYKSFLMIYNSRLNRKKYIANLKQYL